MICPSCKKEIRDGLKFCNSCGAKIEAKQSNETKNIKICPSCKKEVREGLKFCNGCGAKLEAEVKETKVEAKKEEKKTEAPKTSSTNSNIIDYTKNIFGKKIDLDMSSFTTYKAKEIIPQI